MAAENEVFQGVPEVVEKCGLDMSSYQDLRETNGINHVGVVSSPKRDSMENSYVFVSGVDDPVDVVAVPLDPVVSSENHVLKEFTIIPNGDHVDSTVEGGGGVVKGSESTIIPNDHVESTVAEGGGVVEGSESTIIPNDHVESTVAEGGGVVEGSESTIIPNDHVEPTVVEGGGVVEGSESTIIPNDHVESTVAEGGGVVEGSESTIIPNDHVEPTVADGGGVVEGSDAIVQNQGSPLKKEVGIVLVDATSSEIPRYMGNPGAESEEVQTESASSVLPIEDQAHQVASTVVLVNATSSKIHDMGNPGAESEEVQTESAPSVLPIEDQAPQVASTVVLFDATSSEIPHDMGNPGAESEEVQTESAPSVLPIEDQAPQVASTVVLVDATSSEIPHDMGNPGAESGEVQTESAPYVLPMQEQAPQVASTESLEQPIGALSADSEADVLLETSIQPAQREESKVVLLEENTGPGGSVELKGEPAFAGNSGDPTEASEGENKYLERLAPDTNNASEGNKETMELSAELSARQDCRDMELEATSQSQDVKEASDIKEVSNEYKEGAAKLDTYNEPIDVNMELKENPELDISRESITLSPDVGETGDENQDCKYKQHGTSGDLKEVLEAPITIEADGYQLEETESEKLNLKEQNDCELINDKSVEHECKVVVSDSPGCQSAEDVEIMTLRSDVQLETEKAQPGKEGGTTQIHGVVRQLDVDSKQESDSSDIQDDQVRMQQTINKENVLDPALCQNEFDVCAPPLNDGVPQHDEPCEQTDGSVNILFGSLRTETEMNSKPVKSNESWEDTTTDNEVENQASTLSEATKFTDDVGVSPADDSLRAETKKKPVKNDEGAPSDCQDVPIVHEIDNQAPRSSSASCTDAANEAGMEEEALGTIDNRDDALNIEDDDSHAEDVIVASNLKASSEICGGDVHTNSDATVVLESSIKEGASDLLLGNAEVKSAADGLSDAVKNQEVNLLTQYNGATGESQSNEVSADLTGSSTSATARQEFEETRPRPFNFLVKLPRFDDEKLRDQIRSAQLEVDEKTRHRDAFRVQIQNKRPNLRSFGVAYDAAVAQEIDARRHLKATRIKIESLQSLIGRMKNALSVEDIDARIYNIEHRMQHETVSLKEEKQFIREIKQLKQHREYLSSNIGSQDEIQQALNEKDQNEDRLKTLKKELVELKEKVSTAQAAAATVGKKYENENKIIQELQNQYRVANDVRQAAYENLLSLKKKLYEKNEHFRKYKSDISAASDYALSRNETALNRLCVGQMEMMMELWNTNEEFRKEYIRCNLRSTVRRLGTVDGRSLGPDEEPPVLPSYAIVRVDRSTSNPNSKTSSVETVVEKKIEPKIATVVVADRKPVTEVTELVKQTAKMIEPERSRLANGLASSSGADGYTSINGQNLEAIEEHDSARKEEDSRKEVETAKLKEQDRLNEIAKAKEALERKKLDEIAKAKEALERKKRLAEKAQMRAELRAQKEAEQREKEREKKLRKKERRKVGGAGEAPESNNHVDIEQSSEAGTETAPTPAEVVRKPQKPSHFVKQSKSKPIPPPLRNRNRKKLQQWLWVIVTSLLVIALFLLGNIGIFSKVRPHRSGF